MAESVAESGCRRTLAWLRVTYRPWFRDESPLGRPDFVELLIAVEQEANERDAQANRAACYKRTEARRHGQPDSPSPAEPDIAQAVGVATRAWLELHESMVHDAIHDGVTQYFMTRAPGPETLDQLIREGMATVFAAMLQDHSVTVACQPKPKPTTETKES